MTDNTISSWFRTRAPAACRAGGQDDPETLEDEMEARFGCAKHNPAIWDRTNSRSGLVAAFIAGLRKAINNCENRAIHRNAHIGPSARARKRTVRVDRRLYRRVDARGPGVGLIAEDGAWPCRPGAPIG